MKEFFVNDGYNFYGMEIQPNELNPAAEQLASSGIFNPNWDNSMDQSDLFESTLSSIVSSPAASHAGAIVGGGDNVMMRELIGRLGSICNSGEISPQSYIGGTNNNSTNTSCYNTPLNSPPKLNLSVMDSQIRGNFSLSGNNFLSHQNLAPFSADPGFTERAARFSCFGSRNLGSLNGKFGSNEAQELANRSMPVAGKETGKLSRVSSNKSFNIAGIGSQVGIQESNKSSMQNGNLMPSKKLNKFSRCSTPENAGDSREGSSVSEQIIGGELSLKAKAEANTRKRKSVPTGEVKDIKAAGENRESNGKKIKAEDASKKEMDSAKGKTEAKDGTKTAGDANQKQENDNSKPPEPPKDYIHVRARRGQATDSHSLAERVRREKISKRMKFLQDLVPGCNKVTGKAVMLDEIINYVQSLQHQVEFLSMKLATVNPRTDFNMETLLPKDIFKSSGSLPHPFYPMDSSVPPFPHEYQSMLMPPLQNGISNGSEKPFQVSSGSNVMQRNLSGQVPNGYSEVGVEVSKFWEDDLHSVVQMGYGQNQLQNVNDQMKSEL